MEYPLLAPALEALKLQPPEAFGMSYSFPIPSRTTSDLIGHLYMHAFGPVQGIPYTADGEPIDYLMAVANHYHLPRKEVVRPLYILKSYVRMPEPWEGVFNFHNFYKLDTLIPPEHRKRIMLNTLECTMHSGKVDYGPHILTYLKTLPNNLSTTEAPSHGT